MKTFDVEGVECAVWRYRTKAFEIREQFVAEVATPEQKAAQQKARAPQACALCPLVHKAGGYKSGRECRDACEDYGGIHAIYIPAKSVPILRMRGVPDDDFV